MGIIPMRTGQHVLRFARIYVSRLLAAGVLCAGLAGCSKLHSKPADQYVYVTDKQQFLQDRVAAVSNRTGVVVNGDKLKVLEHGHKFLKVETAKGAVGWIRERAVVTDEVPKAFEQLAKDHANDSVVASAVVRDEVNVHLEPGRTTQTFYRFTEGDKLKLLKRATIAKGSATDAALQRQRAIPQAKGTNAAKPIAPDAAKPAAAEAKAAPDVKPVTKKDQDKKDADKPPPPPPVMEDWWLVRDQQGRTGWLLSRMFDVDVPDSVARYAEEQRIVGAYVLTTVNDPEAEGTDKNIPIYLTVLGPYKSGLPYDFDQVRVFTWSMKKHRYETGFREKNIEGYLPVSVKMAPDVFSKPGTVQALPAPTFSYKLLSADAPPVVPDPTTGFITPGKLVTRTFRLEGNYIRRVAAPGTPTEQVAHVEPVSDKKDKKGKKK